MRILFVGAVDFSRHCLEEVLRNGGNVVAVLTLPEEKGRRVHSDYADLSETASQYNVPLYRLQRRINAPENVDLIRSLEPDVIFVFGWSQIVSKEVLDIPPLGCIGTHPALLPRNRGRHPLIWALAKGMRESGLTFFYLDEGVDSGDILWQKSFPITLEDDAGTLYEKIKALASEAIPEFLPQLEGGAAPRIPQNHHLATYWRKRTESDGEIDWSHSTIRIYNLIRALTHPYVGAHTYLGGQKIIIWKAKLPDRGLSDDEQILKPGTILASGEKWFNVRTGDGFIKVSEYEATGRALVEIGTRLGGHA